MLTQTGARNACASSQIDGLRASRPYYARLLWSGERHAHRCQCRGDGALAGAGLCIGIGALRLIARSFRPSLETVSDRAVELQFGG